MCWDSGGVLGQWRCAGIVEVCWDSGGVLGWDSNFIYS